MCNSCWRKTCFACEERPGLANNDGFCFTCKPPEQHASKEQTPKKNKQLKPFCPLQKKMSALLETQGAQAWLRFSLAMFELQESLRPIINAVVEGPFLESIKAEIKSYAPYFERIDANENVRVLSKKTLPFPLMDESSSLERIWSLPEAKDCPWWRVEQKSTGWRFLVHQSDLSEGWDKKEEKKVRQAAEQTATEQHLQDEVTEAVENAAKGYRLELAFKTEERRQFHSQEAREKKLGLGTQAYIDAQIAAELKQLGWTEEEELARRRQAEQKSRNEGKTNKYAAFVEGELQRLRTYKLKVDTSIEVVPVTMMGDGNPALRRCASGRREEKKCGSWWLVQTADTPARLLYLPQELLQQRYETKPHAKQAVEQDSRHLDSKEKNLEAKRRYHFEYLTKGERKVCTEPLGVPSPGGNETKYNGANPIARLWAEVAFGRHRERDKIMMKPQWDNCNASKWGVGPVFGVWEMVKACLNKMGDHQYALQKQDAADLSADMQINLMQVLRHDAFEDRADSKTLEDAYRARCEDYGHVVLRDLSQGLTQIDKLIDVLKMPNLTKYLDVPASLGHPTWERYIEACVDNLRELKTNVNATLTPDQATKLCNEAKLDREIACVQKDIFEQKVPDEEIEQKERKLMDLLQERAKVADGLDRIKKTVRSMCRNLSMSTHTDLSIGAELNLAAAKVGELKKANREVKKENRKLREDLKRKNQELQSKTQEHQDRLAADKKKRKLRLRISVLEGKKNDQSITRKENKELNKREQQLRTLLRAYPEEELSDLSSYSVSSSVSVT
jgi:hypothetical protein